MLRELTKSDWLSVLGLHESRVPAALIVRGTRNFRRRYAAMLPFFDAVTELGTPNGILEDVLVGDVRGVPVGFACVYGAAMASEVVHVFGVLGTRVVVQIGNCGALADGFEAGDLFVADRAFCGEGAAQYYRPGEPWVSASPELVAAVKAREPTVRTGAIYTTGALFAESAADLDRWHADGFAGVDLETAATFAVAEHFGMARVALLYGFDNPRRREHLLLTDAEKDARRAGADARMKAIAIELAASCGPVTP